MQGSTGAVKTLNSWIESLSLVIHIWEIFKGFIYAANGRYLYSLPLPLANPRTIKACILEEHNFEALPSQVLSGEVEWAFENTIWC